MEEVVFTNIQVQYNTKIPKLVDYDIPALITQGIWDVYIEFDVFVTELGVDKFIREGAGLFQPTIYRIPNETLRYKGSSIDDRASTVSADAFDLSSAPQGTTPNGDYFSDTVGDWIKLPDQNRNMTPSKFFLIRHFVFPDQLSLGSYTLTLKPRTVRGPDI